MKSVDVTGVVNTLKLLWQRPALAWNWLVYKPNLLLGALRGHVDIHLK